ncbi:hypothetical protein SHKM778_84650 [Streptomyces sp. KM77-8]|uniref:Response regulator transcription factor n=1 Tax=Streptomyces haneummycinicus TaxID=3074435 RepID=A0AAT9HX48_9ACTN
MADSFGPMRDEDAGDGVGMGPDADTPRKEPIRVLVVDDHALFRRGLEIVLAAEEDIQVVGEAGTAPRPWRRRPTCCPTSS